MWFILYVPSKDTSQENPSPIQSQCYTLFKLQAQPQQFGSKFKLKFSMQRGYVFKWKFKRQRLSFSIYIAKHGETTYEKRQFNI